jgi:hypothetical protein
LLRAVDAGEELAGGFVAGVGAIRLPVALEVCGDALAAGADEVCAGGTAVLILAVHAILFAVAPLLDGYRPAAQVVAGEEA